MARYDGRQYHAAYPMGKLVAVENGGGGARTPLGRWWCRPWEAHGPAGGWGIVRAIAVVASEGLRGWGC